MKVVLAILVVAVSGLVECRSRFLGRDIHQLLPSFEKHADKIHPGFAAFAQLAGKCEVMKEMGYDLYQARGLDDDDDDDQSILQHACPVVFQIYGELDGADAAEIGRIGARLNQALPLLMCTLIEAEVEAIEYLRADNGENSQYVHSMDLHFGDNCEAVYDTLNKERSDLDATLDDVENTLDGGEGAARALLKRLLEVASRKTRK